MQYKLLKEHCITKKVNIKFDEPMSKHTSLRIGGNADIALFPDEDAIAEIIEILAMDKIPYTVIGGGTNILVKDSGIEGAVIFTSKMNSVTYETQYRSQNTDIEYLIVQAGCTLTKVINMCIEHGLSGMEGLAGIPGTIGGAIAGNAGSFGYETKDVILSVKLLMADGYIKELSVNDMVFQYRNTNIPPQAIILSAILCLKKDEKVEVKKRTTEFINEKKLRQPVSKPSAGCVFKNPNGISAGRLIDEAGCKGMRVGDVEVSTMHANFFINKGNATADDFLKLMDMVSKKVKDRFGIFLEPEIKILGR